MDFYIFVTLCLFYSDVYSLRGVDKILTRSRWINDNEQITKRRRIAELDCSRRAGTSWHVCGGSTSGRPSASAATVATACPVGRRQIIESSTLWTVVWERITYRTHTRARLCYYEKRASEITTSIEWESGAGEKVRGGQAKKRSKQKRINALSSELKVMFLLFTRGGRHATLDINRCDRLVPVPLIQNVITISIIIVILEVSLLITHSVRYTNIFFKNSFLVT